MTILIFSEQLIAPYGIFPSSLICCTVSSFPFLLLTSSVIPCCFPGSWQQCCRQGYLRKVLRNHTAHTCDGEQLLIICPRKTTISILGAFYGRRVPSTNLCPSPENASQESTECTSATAHLKLLDECQDQQWCQFSVHSQVFGPDPCPGTHKYLIVSYKCRPGNHRVKTVCENDKLRLQCRPKSILAIYSASYGRFLRGKPECDALNTGGPHIECVAPDALRRVSKKCHRKGNCTVAADKATFGDPCLPGTKKQLRVSYTCVPKQLLEEVGPDTSDPFLLSDYMHAPDEHLCHMEAIPWSLAILRRWRWYLLGAGERRAHGVIPADSRALVKEGWSVVWGRTGRSRQPGHRAPRAPCVSACTPLSLQVAGTKGPGSPGSGKTA
ncbi:protein eva-1 homolog C-like isoform X4 [Parus major]|uniref:protein eva-1 homolog C-like isoform X4 n=1 Tax=Parus major TaxID=9157 RepID=UPI001443D0CB|nr:protein eva-1 homolog C-like isoform X4 [Parus major]